MKTAIEEAKELIINAKIKSEQQLRECLICLTGLNGEVSLDNGLRSMIDSFKAFRNEIGNPISYEEGDKIISNPMLIQKILALAAVYAAELWAELTKQGFFNENIDRQNG